MPNTNVYTQALMDHVSHPDYNYELDDATYSHEGINPSCGDDLTLHVRLADDGTIDEASWTGSGCAISQASADMMSDLVEGMTVADALDEMLATGADSASAADPCVCDCGDHASHDHASAEADPAEKDGE